MPKKTQNTIILEHLRTREPGQHWLCPTVLTTIQAFDKYRITRLASRVFELRKAGHDIRDVSEPGENYAVYQLFE